MFPNSMASILGGPLGEEIKLATRRLARHSPDVWGGCNDRVGYSIGADTKMIKKNSTAKNLARR